MVGKWLVVLPLLVNLHKVILQPIMSDSSENTQITSARRIRQLDLQDCCPCTDVATGSGARSRGDGWMDRPMVTGCPCPRSEDTEASASFILPALRAIQPFVKQGEQKSEPKPLLQPEVGLASSVLETLRQATDEEYQEALARDAARTAVKLIESNLDPLDGAVSETPKNVVKIFLNPKADDMDDNLPEQSHVQETRCIHPQLQSIHRNEPLVFRTPLEIFHKKGDLKLNRPIPKIEVIDIPSKPMKKLKNKGLLHRNLHDMDNGIGASNIQERVIQPNLDSDIGNLNLKSNPALFSLFGNNIENSEDNAKNSFEKHVNDGVINGNYKSKPKINYKLRELIDNLQLKTEKEKPKIPLIDLKKYFSTSTRTPPLQFKPLEKSVYNKPLLLKDILKLKDVELIPRKDLTKNVARKSLYPNLKLQSENSKINLDNDNYEENIITKPPRVTSDIGDPEISPSNTQRVFELIPQKGLIKNVDGKSYQNLKLQSENSKINLDNDHCEENIITKPPRVTSDIGDPEISPSNTQRVFELIPQKGLIKNVDGKSYQNLKLQSENSKINLDNDHCEENIISNPPITSEIGDPEISSSNAKPVFESKNNQANSIIKQNMKPIECVLSSENYDINSNQPVDLDPNNNFDLGDIDNVEDPNSEKLLLDNCDNPTESLIAQNVPNNENQKEGLNVNGFEREKAHKLEDSEDTLNEESNNKAFPIELVEDLDFPVEFDDSSFIQNSDLENNNDFQHINTNDAVQSTINDHIGSKNSNNLQIEESNEHFNEDQEDLENNDNNCITSESFSQNFNILSEGQSSEPNHQELMSMEQESPEDRINLSGNVREAISNINEDPSKVSFKDLQDMSDSILKVSDECEPSKEKDITNNNLNTISETNFEEKAESPPDIEANVDSRSELNEASDLNSKENLCHTLIADEAPNNLNKADANNSLTSLTEEREMIAAASEPESRLIVEKKINSDDSPTILFRNIIHDLKDKKSFTKPTADLSDVLQRNTNLEFLNSLRSKLDGLFSTSDKIKKSDALNSPDDNINESSNTNPITAKFNHIKNSDKLTRTPQSLLSQVSPFKLPMHLDSYKNKLTLPKYADLTNDRQNFLNFPLEVTRPLENTLDHSLDFGALSEKLRTHTENTLQNVKETLDSTIKDSQSFRISRPSETFDTQNVLESLSNRHDDMKEKLEAIHLDLNDRFSSFQQSVIDHINQPLGRISAFQEENSHEGFRSSYIPVRKESSLPNVKDERNLLTLRENALNRGRKTDISIKSPSIPKAPDAPRFRNSDRKPTLQNPTTTTIPSFIPRKNVLKTNIDMTPKLNRETLSKATTSEVPNLLQNKVTKSKFFEKSPSSASYGSSPRNNFPLKTLKTNKNNLSEDNLAEESPVHKLRKTLLQRAQNQKSRNELTKSNQGLGISSNSLNSDANIDSSNKKESLLSRIKDGRSNIGYRNDMIRSPTTQIDNTHPAQLEEGIRLVEPMKENVPYKCKLICYRDS